MPFIMTGVRSYAYDDVFNLGTVRLGAELKRSIPVHNTSGLQMKLRNITSSCDCLKILSYSEIVSTSTAGNIEISLAPQKTGELTYEVDAHGEDNQGILFKYLLMVTVVEGNRYARLEVSPEFVEKARKSGEPMALIDVRSSAQFDQCRIPGSINMPLYAVKTKGFLTNKTIVLSNEGYSYSELAKEAENLKNAGLKVWILNGGLNRWVQEGFPVEGDAGFQKGLNKISSEAFMSVRSQDAWLVVDVSKLRNNDMLLLSSRAVHVPYDGNTSFVTTIEKALRQFSNGPSGSVLIVTKNGEEYGNIEKMLGTSKKWGNMFYLKDGLDGYRKYVSRQTLLLNPKSESTTRTSVQNSSVPKKPCASCP